MKKLVSALLGGVMLSVAALGFTAPVKADSMGFGPFGFNSGNIGWNDDWRWRRHHNWDRRGYYDNDWRGRGHHRHHWYDDDYDDDFGDAAGAIIFGLAAGAIAGGIAAGAVDDDSYYRCKARYRSFDEDSWTYLGYDNERHYCRL